MKLLCGILLRLTGKCSIRVNQLPAVSDHQVTKLWSSAWGRDVSSVLRQYRYLDIDPGAELCGATLREATSDYARHRRTAGRTRTNCADPMTRLQ